MYYKLRSIDTGWTVIKNVFQKLIISFLYFYLQNAQNAFIVNSTNLQNVSFAYLVVLRIVMYDTFENRCFIQPPLLRAVHYPQYIHTHKMYSSNANNFHDVFCNTDRSSKT